MRKIMKKFVILLVMLVVAGLASSIRPVQAAPDLALRCPYTRTLEVSGLVSPYTKLKFTNKNGICEWEAKGAEAFPVVLALSENYGALVQFTGDSALYEFIGSKKSVVIRDIAWFKLRFLKSTRFLKDPLLMLTNDAFAYNSNAVGAVRKVVYSGNISLDNSDCLKPFEQFIAAVQPQKADNASWHKPVNPRDPYVYLGDNTLIKAPRGGWVWAERPEGITIAYIIGSSSTTHAWVWCILDYGPNTTILH
jgi:hypothetical protein